jgi:hypothetical protein
MCGVVQAQIEAREKDVQEQIAMKRRSVYEDVKSMRLAATAVVYEMVRSRSEAPLRSIHAGGKAGRYEDISGGIWSLG